MYGHDSLRYCSVMYCLPCSSSLGQLIIGELINLINQPSGGPTDKCSDVIGNHNAILFEF